METLDKQISDAIDQPTAAYLFDVYVTHLAKYMPAVVFSSDTKASDIRSSKPILFLAILVAASVGIIPMDVQAKLAHILMGSLADSVIRKGEKSIAIIQALVIHVIWYRPPKRYDHMNFYQLTHIAAIMAIDIGLGKRMPAAKSSQMQAVKKRGRTSKLAPGSDPLEPWRTWVGCYWLCAK